MWRSTGAVEQLRAVVASASDINAGRVVSGWEGEDLCVCTSAVESLFVYM